MKKNFTVWLIALFGLMGMCAATMQAQTTPKEGKAGPLTWKYDEGSKTLTISGTGEMPDYNEGRSPWSGFGYTTTTVVIGEGVSTIGKESFAEMVSLTSITLPKSLTKIGGKSFTGCVKLTSVTIPAGVKEIGASAFLLCPALTEIKVDAANTVYTSVDGVLFNKAKTVLHRYPGGRPNGKYDIPAGVKTVAPFAFFSVGHLHTLTAPAGIELFGNSAFAFSRSLSWVSLPDANFLIRDLAFCGCASLKSITVKSKTPPRTAFDAFEGVPVSSVKLNVPKGAGAAYKADSEWKAFKIVVEATANVLLPEARIYTADGRLYLTLSRAETVHIYNVSGALVRTFNAPAGETSITLPQGVYVVRAGERTEKVFIH